MVLMATTEPIREKQPNRKERRDAIFRVDYELEVRDKDGKLLSRTKGVAHSFVKAFIQSLAIYLQATTTTGTQPTGAVLDIGSVSRTIPYSANYSGIFIRELAGTGASADAGRGIVVGKGTGTPTINDVALGTLLENGSGLNQLIYGTQSWEAVVVSAPTASVRITRTFTNQYASSQTVYEIGWYLVQQDTTGSGTDRTFCILHDLLTAPQTVPNGATLTVRYTLSTSN